MNEDPERFRLSPDSPAPPNSPVVVGLEQDPAYRYRLSSQVDASKVGRDGDENLIETPD